MLLYQYYHYTAKHCRGIVLSPNNKKYRHGPAPFSTCVAMARCENANQHASTTPVKERGVLCWCAGLTLYRPENWLCTGVVDIAVSPRFPLSDFNNYICLDNRWLACKREIVFTEAFNYWLMTEDGTLNMLWVLEIWQWAVQQYSSNIRSSVAFALICIKICFLNWWRHHLMPFTRKLQWCSCTATSYTTPRSSLMRWWL